MLKYKKQQRKHVKDRAIDRYNEQLNRFDLRVLSAKIRDGDAVFLKAEGDSASSWAVKYNGRWFAALYDRRTQQVSTLLPQQLLIKYREKIFGQKIGSEK